MPITVLSDWFLLEVEKTIAQLEACLALKNLRRLISHFLYLLQQCYLSITSIALWRLILLVLKRIISIIKAGLKYFLIDLPVPVLEFLYVLHFARAFLTLINFFQDRDNKNLVEITKFLYACFKIFISLLMLSFLIVLLMHGMAPLGLLAYEHIKTLFRIYTFSKFGISLLTLGFSYYKTKSYPNDAEHAWLQAHYQANLQKHTHILVLGSLITALLTLVSVFGFGLGPIGLAVVIVLAGVLLIVDIAKTIYFYKNGCSIPEPSIGSLAQQNSLIDFSTKDYYYRKCRIARLKIDDPETNQIYLLKEIVVKIIQLENKLKNYSQRKFSFFPSCFSEKQKIQEKITGLIQTGHSLIDDDYEKTEQLFNKVIASLNNEYDEVVNNNYNVLLKTKLTSEVGFLEFNSKNNSKIDSILWRIFLFYTKKSSPSQAFRQSFFRKKGDCEDISDACQKLKELEPRELNTETRLQIFPVRMTQYILAAG
jgi:uncharacterized membrane protein